MMPSIVLDLQKKYWNYAYVNAFSETPDNGFMQFFDSPRYSTGYTSLFNTIGFVVEHMLKKYADRVKQHTNTCAPQLILWMQITRKSNKCVCKWKTVCT
jgi:hypothetical protein